MNSSETRLAITMEQAIGLRACLLEAWTDDVFADPGQAALVEQALAALEHPHAGAVVRISDLVLSVDGAVEERGGGREGLDLVRTAILHAQRVVEEWELHARLGVNSETLDQLRVAFVGDSA